MRFTKYAIKQSQYYVVLIPLLLLLSCTMITSSVQIPMETSAKSPNLQGQTIQSDSASLSVPYVDEHYGYADGIIDPKEYAVNFTDPDTGISAYFEHNGTTLFVGLSGDTTGTIGLGWKNATESFVGTGLNGSDLIYGYAPGSPYSSYSRVTLSDAVTVYYSLYISSGLIEEGAFPNDEDQTPLSDQPILEGYKEAIVGMRIGEIKHFVIPAEDAYNSPEHPLYGEDLHYVITLTRINSNFNNPTDSSQVAYNDRYGNDTLDSYQDSDQSRILSANASDDGTVTQVEYFIQMNSEDVDDIPLLESTELEFPFVFLNSTEDFDETPTVYTDWTSPLLLKFLPNTAPVLTVESPIESSLVEGIISIEANITDNTFVRSTLYRVDYGEWEAIRYNSLTGLWNTTLNTDDYDLGEHTLWFNATDPSNVVVSLHFNVTFVDYSAPEIDSPPDIEIEGSPVGYSITWHPYDGRPDWLLLLLNGSEIVSSNWDGGEIQVDLDSLDLGVYNYTVVVTDTEGHQVSDSVIVTITEFTETTPPDDTIPTSNNDTTPPSEDTNYLSIAITVISVGVIIIVCILFWRTRGRQ
ncbi:MAG: FKBP-type peptidyl-prolyl cis-trans isomerase [Candidatus Thorarchaeota archaeon]